ncbi:MAG: hypothetical protein LBN93_00470 [Candidatus Symbiothrix sp.]|jgi:hypothetical protein|nr:hypothetical protein [Candidatus Symbiothrix sp.]
MKIDKLFDEMPLVNPSAGFTDTLMYKIEKELARQKRRSQWLTIAALAASIIGIFVLPAGVFYLCSLFFPDRAFSFSFPKIELAIPSMIALTGLSILILLLGDMLLRKRSY